MGEIEQFVGVVVVVVVAEASVEAAAAAAAADSDVGFVGIGFHGKVVGCYYCEILAGSLGS